MQKPFQEELKYVPVAKAFEDFFLFLVLNF